MARFAERGGWWVVGQVALLALLVAALGWTVVWPWWIRAAGAALALAGVALFVAGVVALGRNLTPYPEPLPEGALVETGVYGISRHPLYGGVALLGFGVALAAASPAALAVALLLTGFLTLKSSVEERRLVTAHPGYADYRRRVRARLIPWIW
jgi:protein-S-isoprenylcysteine O-methyltransferase Ste14